jgi:chemotaxis protein CheD
MLTLATQQELTSVTISVDGNPEIEEVRVDMADMKIEHRPANLLTSVGSCVAICVHDPVHRCGGLAHVMLPNSVNGENEPFPSKFANTAVPALMNGINKITGKQSRLSAKIAGGANMFSNLGPNHLDIGAKNVKAVKNALEVYRIRLTGEDVGGLHGRRVSFNVSSGETFVRTFNGGVKAI